MIGHHLDGPEIKPEDFTVIDHSGEHREAATLPDPYGGYILPPRKKETPKKWP